MILDRCAACCDLITDPGAAELAAISGDRLCTGCRWSAFPWWWRAWSALRSWVADVRWLAMNTDSKGRDRCL